VFEVAKIGLLTASLAGLISFVAPCVLQLAPYDDDGTLLKH